LEGGNRNDVWEFNTDDLTWRELETRGDLRPPARRGHQSIMIAGEMWIFGGYTDAVEENCWALAWSDDQPPVWCPVRCTGDAPRLIALFSAVLLGGVVFVFGGHYVQSRSSVFEYSSQLFALELSSNPAGPMALWTTMATRDHPSPRFCHCSTIVEGHLIVFGGTGPSPDDAEEEEEEENDANVTLGDLHILDLSWLALHCTQEACQLRRAREIAMTGRNNVDEIRRCSEALQEAQGGGEIGSKAQGGFLASLKLVSDRVPSVGDGVWKSVSLRGTKIEDRNGMTMITLDPSARRGRINIEVLLCGGGVPGTTYFGDTNILTFELRPTVRPTECPSPRREKLPIEDQIRFLVSGEAFVASRSRLVSSSDYFEALLSGRFAEASSEQVEVQDIDPKVFRYLLDFEGHADPELCTDVLAAADRFCMPELKLRMEKQLSGMIEEDNVSGLLSFAKDAGCPLLAFMCESHMREDPAGHDVAAKAARRPCGRAGCDQVGRSACGGCKAVRYCSRGCQRADWGRHGPACRAARAHGECP